MSGYNGGYGGGRYGGGAGDYPASPGGRDRLAELRARGIGYNDTFDSAMDIEMGPTGAPGGGGAATEFLDQIAKVDHRLRQLGEDIMHIEELQRSSFDAVPDGVAQQKQRDLDETTAMARDALARIRTQLGGLDARLKSGRDLKPGTPDYVMCANQLVTQQKKCQERVRAFHAAETAFAQRQRDRMLREMRVLKPDATMRDVDEYLEAGNTAGGSLFAQEVLHSNRYGDARRALLTVQDRQTEIRKIEETVEQLAVMFQDLNTLLEHQEYQVNQIAEYADQVADDLAKGEVQVTKAMESRRNTIKWLWYLCFLIIIILIGVILYLLFGSPRLIDKIKGQQ